MLHARSESNSEDGTVGKYFPSILLLQCHEPGTTGRDQSAGGIIVDSLELRRSTVDLQSGVVGVVSCCV